MFSKLLVSSVILFFITACKESNVKHEYPYDIGGKTYKSEEAASKREKLFGDMLTFGGKDQDGLPVNLYLWRASIDALTFMGLEKADPAQGIIETKWYTDPAVSNERIKVNVSILGKVLSVENLRVAIKKEIRRSGVWKKKTVSRKTILALEDVILSRATEFKINEN